MARYIDADVFADRLLNAWNTADEQKRADIVAIMANIVTPLLVGTPTADVAEVVRCNDCLHASEFEEHCELNSFAYRHCELWKGDETKNVWHKYKKYYRDYSIVEADEFCSSGVRREE